MRRDTEVCALPQEYCRVFGDAQAARNPRNDVEHGLQIELRTTDNTQHLACCCLIFERFLQLPFACLLGLEQPRVVNGDDRLVGEGLYELNLLWGKGAHVAASAPDYTDDDFPSEHWHGKDGANPRRLLAHPCIFGIVRHVMDVDDPALQYCPPRRRLAALRDRVLFCDLYELGRNAVNGRCAINLAVLSDDESLLGARELHGALDQTVQHFLQRERRAADGLQNLGSRGFSPLSVAQLTLQLLDNASQFLLRGCRRMGTHDFYPLKFQRNFSTTGTMTCSVASARRAPQRSVCYGNPPHHTVLH